MRLAVPGYPIRPRLTGLSPLAPTNQFTPSTCAAQRRPRPERPERRPGSAHSEHRKCCDVVREPETLKQEVLSFHVSFLYLLLPLILTFHLHLFPFSSLPRPLLSFDLMTSFSASNRFRHLPSRHAPSLPLSLSFPLYFHL